MICGSVWCKIKPSKLGYILLIGTFGKYIKSQKSRLRVTEVSSSYSFFYTQIVVGDSASPSRFYRPSRLRGVIIKTSRAPKVSWLALRCRVNGPIIRIQSRPLKYSCALRAKSMGVLSRPCTGWNLAGGHVEGQPPNAAGCDRVLLCGDVFESISGCQTVGSGRRGKEDSERLQIGPLTHLDVVQVN